MLKELVFGGDVAKAPAVWNRSFIIKGRFRVIAKVFKVPDDSKKHPEGVKAKFLLLDLDTNKPRLLVDNHAPFGFHMHVGLPASKDLRVELETIDFVEAYTIFMREVERIISEAE